MPTAVAAGVGGHVPIQLEDPPTWRSPHAAFLFTPLEGELVGVLCAVMWPPYATRPEAAMGCSAHDPEITSWGRPLAFFFIRHRHHREYPPASMISIASSLGSSSQTRSPATRADRMSAAAREADLDAEL